MMMIRNILLVSVVVSCCLASPPEDREQKVKKSLYGICSSPADCAKDECCVLPTMRYAYPSCQPMRQEGEICRPGADIRSSHFEFPDGSIFTYKDGHMFLCPCATNLTCEKVAGNEMPKCSQRGEQSASK